MALGADGFGGNGFQAYSGGNSAFLIVDLFGYFEVAHRAAQALDCTTTSNQLVALSGSQTITTNSSCPAGYQVTSANCFTADSALSLLGSGVNTINNFSACTWHNFSPSASGNTQNYATCCRTAGY